MPEARATRSKGWRLALLGLACCAAEADVLATQGTGPSGELDAGVSSSADAGAAAVWDAAFYPNVADGSWIDEPARFDAGMGPTWTTCDPQIIFERARTGDSCQFYGCYEQVADCELRVAMCVKGVLHLGEVSKSVCTPDDPSNARRCYAVEAEGCCVGLWQCDGMENVYRGEPLMRVCAPRCETKRLVPETQAVVTGCPNDPDTPPWPRGSPPLGMPCDGSFVCDSFGNAAGPTSAFRFDEYGLIYWCQGGIVQRAPIGNLWLWNEPVFP